MEKPITVFASFSHFSPRMKKKIMHIIKISNVVVTILNAYIPYSLFDFLIQLNRTNINQIFVDPTQLNSHLKHIAINFTSPQIAPHENAVKTTAANIIISVAAALLFFFIFFSNHII